MFLSVEIVKFCGSFCVHGPSSWFCTCPLRPWGLRLVLGFTGMRGEKLRVFSGKEGPHGKGGGKCQSNRSVPRVQLTGLCPLPPPSPPLLSEAPRLRVNGPCQSACGRLSPRISRISVSRNCDPRAPGDKGFLQACTEAVWSWGWGGNSAPGCVQRPLGHQSLALKRHQLHMSIGDSE